MIVDPVLPLWLKFEKNIKQTYDCPECPLSSSGVYVGLPSELSTPNPFIEQSM